MTDAGVAGSFRDPAGYVFKQNGIVYRHVDNNETIMELASCGLEKELIEENLMLPYEWMSEDTIRPQQVPFISYPYEWCFSMLKDAALTTLDVCKRALSKGMILKDASAYNIQYVDGRMKLIDHLSFEPYMEGQPWIAYRQFCQHFLAPLALMNYKDVRLNQLLRIYLDGIPLDLTSLLLPLRAKLNSRLLLHIYAHAKAQKRYADKPMSSRAATNRVSHTSLLGIIDNLESSVRGLSSNVKDTEWENYYECNNNYVLAAIAHKKQLVSKFLDTLRPQTVWDLGANTGLFSRIASDKGAQVISFDSDHSCVETNYLAVKNSSETRVLPLLLDLTNPSPGIGWENQERMSLLERGPVDTVFALALIHHLAISNNLPFSKIAVFLQKACKSLLIEFIPKNDTNTQKLLTTRNDTFPDYTPEAFDIEFSKLFSIQSATRILNSDRTLYLMVNRKDIN